MLEASKLLLNEVFLTLDNLRLLINSLQNNAKFVSLVLFMCEHIVSERPEYLVFY